MEKTPEQGLEPVKTRVISGMQYHGEAPCDFSGCTKKAYYSASRRVFCGRHSHRATRVELPKNPNAKAVRAAIWTQWFKAADEAATNRAGRGERGRVIVRKLRMMQNPTPEPGFLMVFPNNKAGGRADGHPCPELSPMRMTDIAHGQPGLPNASSLENLHQGNKVFTEELDKYENPGPLFYANRLRFYTDPEPHRHKFKGTGANPNVPLYSIWVQPDGTEKRNTYIESRRYYCNIYAERALNCMAFHALRQHLDKGYNLQIVGYDGYPLTENDATGPPPTAADFRRMYLDASRPFGHELVLAVLLVLKKEDYPWPAM